MNALPKLSAIEQAHSDKLSDHLQQKIHQAGGKIPFSEFMAACLYAPGLGYYSAGAAKFGQAGDFVTAPEISDLFGQCLAEYYIELKHKNFAQESLSIIEIGAGTGKLAKDILLHLNALNALPEHYYILEVSADLKQKQYTLLKNALPDFIEKMIWLDSIDAIPHFNGQGLIIANEVLDALPVDIIQLKPNSTNAKPEIFQAWVTYHSGAQTFETLYLPADKLFQDNTIEILEKSLRCDLSDFHFDAPIYQSEINLNLFSWLSGIQQILSEGQLLFIDYGFSAKEYYHPSRHMGTLMCHYKHRAHSDFLTCLGLQDITAHVNFTQVALAAQKLDLTIDNFTTQAEFLLSQKLALLAEKKYQLIQNYSVSQQMQLLTAPHEMGELFKVLILQKGELDSIASGRPHFHRL